MFWVFTNNPDNIISFYNLTARADFSGSDSVSFTINFIKERRFWELNRSRAISIHLNIYTAPSRFYIWPGKMVRNGLCFSCSIWEKI